MTAKSVKYRVSDSILKWFEFQPSVSETTSQAISKAKSDQPVQKHIKNAAQTIVDIGKSAYAGMVQLGPLEYEVTFRESEVSLCRNRRIERIPYRTIQRIALEKDVITLKLDHQTIKIRPVVVLSAGKLKVPVGWDRDGQDVPFETLAHEFSGRSGLSVERV